LLSSSAELIHYQNKLFIKKIQAYQATFIQNGFDTTRHRSAVRRPAEKNLDIRGIVVKLAAAVGKYEF